MPPAPPIFSTITCWPRSSDRRGARRRAITSTVLLPAAAGATIVTARVGQLCASAGAANDSVAIVPEMPAGLAMKAIATAAVFPLGKPAMAIAPVDLAGQHAR